MDQSQFLPFHLRMIYVNKHAFPLFLLLLFKVSVDNRKKTVMYLPASRFLKTVLIGPIFLKGGRTKRIWFKNPISGRRRRRDLVSSILTIILFLHIIEGYTIYTKKWDNIRITIFLSKFLKTALICPIVLKGERTKRLWLNHISGRRSRDLVSSILTIILTHYWRVYSIYRKLR